MAGIRIPGPACMDTARRAACRPRERSANVRRAAARPDAATTARGWARAAMEEDEPAGVPAAAPAPAPPPAPWHAAARIIPTSAAALRRRGTRQGDWALISLQHDAALPKLIAALRATQHAELLFAQQWAHPIRLYGDCALGRVRGGDDAVDPGILEVTPPGASAAAARDMYRHHWIANVGVRTAWFAITPKLWGIRVACLNVNGVFGAADRPERGGPQTTLSEVRLAFTYAPPDDGAQVGWAGAAYAPRPTATAQPNAAAQPHAGTQHNAGKQPSTGAQPTAVAQHKAAEKLNTAAQPDEVTQPKAAIKTGTTAVHTANAASNQRGDSDVAAPARTRHLAEFDALLSAAALLSLPKNHTTTVHKHGLGLMSDKDTLRCTQVVQWIAARHRGDPANGRFPELRPTEDAADDVHRGTAVFREMRSCARRKAADRRKKKYEVRKKWEAECIPTQRGVTQRLMKKPGLRLVNILE
eukprot:gene2150-7333_t